MQYIFLLCISKCMFQKVFLNKLQLEKYGVYNTIPILCLSFPYLKTRKDIFIILNKILSASSKTFGA